MKIIQINLPKRIFNPSIVKVDLAHPILSCLNDKLVHYLLSVVIS